MLPTDLGEAPPWRAHASFSQEALLFARGQRRRTIVRDLASGTERELELPGSTLRARFVPRTEYVEARVIGHDVEGPLTPRDDGCDRRPLSLTTAGPSSEATPQRYLVRPRDGWVHPIDAPMFEGDDAATIVTPLADALVLRRTDGALVMATPSAARGEVLVEASCQPFVLAVHDASRRMLVRCIRGDAASVLLVGPEGARRLDVEEGYAPSEERPRRDGYFSAREHLVDLERGATYPVPAHDRILGRSSRRLLYVHGRRFRWMDLESGERRELGASRPGWLPLGLADFVHAGPFTFDVARGRRIGSGEPAAVAFDATGRRLVAAERGDRIARGPLAWHAPMDRSPPPPSASPPSSASASPRPRSARPPAPQVIAETCEHPPPSELARVRLEIARVSPERVRPGEALELEAWLVNGASSHVRVSVDRVPRWNQLRTSPLIVEGSDGAAAPLGWEPEEHLGQLRRLVHTDAAPSRRASLGRFSVPVQSSARDGAQRVRLRVRPHDPCDVPVELVSNAIDIVVEGADAGQTECRQRQRAELATLPQIESHAVAVLPRDEADPRAGAWTLYLRKALGPGAELAAELMVQRLDSAWAPDAVPQRVLPFESDDASTIGVVRTPYGALLAATPEWGGDVLVVALALDADAARVLRVTRLPGPERGVVDVADFRRRGEHVALLRTGGFDGVLDLWRLDLDGRARGPMIDARPGWARANAAAVGIEADGSAWIVAEQALRIATRRFDARGEPDGVPIRLPIQGTPRHVTAEAEALRIVYVDTVSGHQGPLDRMGLMVARWDVATRTVGAPAGLSPVGHEAYVGDVVALGDALVGAYQRWSGGTPEVTAFDAAARRVLGRSTSLPRVQPFGEGFAVVWTDPRLDASESCRLRSRCTGETYAVWLRRGTLAPILGPSRITSDATRVPRTGDEWTPTVRCDP